MKRRSPDSISNKNTAAYGDKYYTAKSCMEAIVTDAVPHILATTTNNILFIDFSAGDGSLAEILSNRLPGVEYIGIDIAPPTQTSVMQGDWTVLEAARDGNDFLARQKITLAVSAARSPGPNGRLVVVGFNPPFGRAGTLAKRFVNIALSWIKPDMMLLILPVRTWHIPNHDLLFTRFLPPASFYLPESGAPFAASSEVVLVRRMPACVPVQVEEHKTMGAGTELTMTARDTGRLQLNAAGPAVILIRKVGEYAGRQMYLLDPCRQRILYFCSGSVAGVVHDFTAALFSEDAGPALIRAGNTPWSQRGHTVCDTDPPSSYRGSKSSSSGQQKRQGTGFLKCTISNWTDLQLTNDAFFRVASNFANFIVEHGLNTGQPRSISAAIAERAWHTAISTSQ